MLIYMVNARDCFRILLLLNGTRSCRLKPQQQISNNKFKIQMNHVHKFQIKKSKQLQFDKLLAGIESSR